LEIWPGLTWSDLRKNKTLNHKTKVVVVVVVVVAVAVVAVVLLHFAKENHMLLDAFDRVLSPKKQNNLGTLANNFAKC